MLCPQRGPSNQAAARGHRPDFTMRPPSPPSRLPLLPFLLLLAFLPSHPAAAAAAGGPAAWESLRAAADRRRASPAAQEAAAAGVLRRLLPVHVSSFRFEIDSKVGSQHSDLLNGMLVLPCLFRDEIGDIVWCVFTFWLLQGTVCGQSSCFRISNVADDSSKGGVEILYVHLHP